MSQLYDLGAALLVAAGQLAIAFPVLRLGERLIVAVATRYVYKPHVPHRPYAGRIEPTGPAGRHRLTLAKRLSRTTYRPVVGHVRWHGRQGDTAPRAVLGGLWTEASDV